MALNRASRQCSKLFYSRYINLLCRFNSTIESELLPKHLGSYVDGRWSATTHNKFAIVNPSNNQEIAYVNGATVDDSLNAARCARSAFETRWAYDTTARQRAALLKKLFDLCMQHQDELGRILCLEQGKPLLEAKGEIAYAASFFDWFGEEARRVRGEIVPSVAVDRQHFHYREPRGVALIITPWNFPLAMITRKMGAALAVGCTVVIKPDHNTPLSAIALAKLCELAQFPPGVVNVIPSNHGDTAQISRALCSSDDIDVVTFTGSTNVGKILLAQCADSIKKVCLELGGNAPFIVFESADIDKAIQGCLASKFRGAGQTCVCANRILVQETIHDQFVERLLAEVKKLKIGDGLTEDVNIGPLINSNAVDKVDGLVRDAVAKGASLHFGGERLGGNYYAPTLLTNVRSDMNIFKEEIFGPVASIIRFGTEDDAIQLANDSHVGLAGYFYSQNMSQIFRVARRLQTGMIGVNEGIISCAEACFGGLKQSGLGREGGSQGIDEFAEWKYVALAGL